MARSPRLLPIAISLGLVLAGLALTLALWGTDRGERCRVEALRSSLAADELQLLMQQAVDRHIAAMQALRADREGSPSAGDPEGAVLARRLGAELPGFQPLKLSSRPDSAGLEPIFDGPAGFESRLGSRLVPVWREALSSGQPRASQTLALPDGGHGVLLVYPYTDPTGGIRALTAGLRLDSLLGAVTHDPLTPDAFRVWPGFRLSEGAEALLVRPGPTPPRDIAPSIRRVAMVDRQWRLEVDPMPTAGGSTVLLGLGALLSLLSGVLAYLTLTRESRLMARVDERTESLRGRESELTRYSETLQDRIARRTAALDIRTTELDEERRKYQDLLESLTAGLVELDRDGKVRFWNSGAEQLTGASRAETLGRPLAQVGGHLATPEVLGTVRRAVESGATKTYIVTHADDRAGGIYAGEVHPGSDGSILFFRDVTEERVLADRLEASEAKYRRIFEDAHDAILITLPDGQIVQANEAWSRLSGYGADQLLELRIGDLFEREPLEAAGWGRADGMTLRRIRRQDGVARSVELSTSPLRLGGELFYLGIARDITERLEAEAAIRAGEERFQLVARATVGAIWDWDLRSGSRWWNDGVQTLFGYPADEPASRPDWWRTHLHPDDRDQVLAGLDEALERGGSWSAEYRFRRADGAFAVILDRGEVLRDGDGTATRMIGGMEDLTERTRLVEQLEAERVRLAAILQNLPVAVIVAEAPSGKLVLGNDQVERIFGHPMLPSEEIGEYREWRAIHSDSGRPVEAHEWPLARAVETGEQVFGMEVDYLRPDGHLSTIRLNAAPIRNASGEIIAGVVIMDDITERRRGELALQSSEERFRIAAESASDSIYEMDLATGVVTWYGAIDERLGYETGEIERTRAGWEALVHPDDQTFAAASSLAQMGESSTYRVEYRVRAKDGSYRDLVDQGTALYDESEQPVRLIGVNTDITERKRAEAALRESEARFRTVADSAPVMLWMADADGRSTYFNRGWLEFHGRPLEAELADRWTVGAHPEDIDRAMSICVEAYAHQTPFTVEYRRRRHDGLYRWVVVTGVPRREADGTFIGFIGSAIDVTERRRSEETLRFLADTGVLLTLAADDQSALVELARLSVPTLADCCIIDLVEPDGRLVNLLIAHVDPVQGELAQQIYGQVFRPGNVVVPAVRVVESGRSELVETMSEAELQAVAASGDEHLAALIGLFGPNGYLSVPFTARGRVFGAMTLVNTEQRRFDRSDLGFAEDLARRAATTVDNKRLYRESVAARQSAEATAERIAQLQRITAALSEPLSQAEVARVVVEQTAAAVGAQAGLVALAIGDEMAILSSTGYDPSLIDSWSRFPLTAAAPINRAYEANEPALIPSVDAVDPAVYPDLAATDAEQRAWAALPLSIEGRRIGGMGLSFNQSQTFSPADRDFLLAIARQCAQALERARLFESERTARAVSEQARGRLALLSEASTILGRSLDPVALLPELAHLLTADLADVCTVDLDLGDGFGLARVAAAHRDAALEPELLLGFAAQYDAAGRSTPLQRALETGRSVFVPTLPAGDDPALTPALRRLADAVPVASTVCVPIVRRDERMGVLTVATAERTLDEGDLDLVEEIARRTAVALDNALLHWEFSQFRATLDATLDGVLLFDPDSLRFTYVNQGAVAQLGLDREALLGQTALQVLGEHDDSRFRSILTLLRDGRSDARRFETYYRHPSGRLIPVELFLQFVSPTGGRPRFIAIVRDLTSQRALQGRLLAEQQRYLAVLEGMNEGFAVLDGTEQTVSYWNAGAERIFKRTRDRTVGQSLWDVLPAARGTAFEARIREGQRQRASLQLDDAIYADEHTRVVLTLSLYPTEADGIAIFFRDESERLELMTDLRRSEQRYRELYDNAPEMYHLTDADGVLLECNRTELDTLGYERRRIIGRPVAELLEPDSVPIFNDLLAAVAGGAEVHDRELHYRRADGSRLTVSLTSRATREDLPGLMTDVALNPHGYVVQMVMRDVTTQRRLQRLADEYYEEIERRNTTLESLNRQLGLQTERAQVANQLKSEFLANVSHELRTPLHAIRSFAEFGLHDVRRLEPSADGESPVVEDVADHLQEIHRAASSLELLVDDILDLSKIEAGRMDYRLGPVAISEIFADVRGVMDQLAAERRQQLDWNVPDDDEIELEADGEKLKVVVRNLVANAVKYTGEGGRIDVRAVRDGEMVEVRVADTGVGIPLEDQVTIFDKFVQSRSVRSASKQGGTGLGLAISKAYVEGHGGVLWVESTPGHGSTFTFRVPLRAERYT